MAAQLFSIVGGVSPEHRGKAARILRDYADAIDAGECSEFVAMFVADDHFHFHRWASKLSAIALTAMAAREAIEQMKG